MLSDAERFFKVFNGLPIEERKTPIIIVDNKTINWELAYAEIDSETAKGKKILKLLMELDII